MAVRSWRSAALERDAKRMTAAYASAVRVLWDDGLMSSREKPTMPALSLRPSTGVAEYPALVVIWRSAVDATHDFLADAHRNEIESHLQSDYFPAVTLSVAELDGQPVGFSGVLDGNLEMLFVDARQRGGGIGTVFSAMRSRSTVSRRWMSTSRTSRPRASTLAEDSRSSVAARQTRLVGRIPLLHLRFNGPS